MPAIHALATASAPYAIVQQQARDFAERLFADDPAFFERMAGVYANAGIETRQLCVPPEWFDAPHGWTDRNAVFTEQALALLETAARCCLDQAALGPEAVDAIVVVSSTGVTTPSLDARLMERLPFRRDVMRLPVFGLGCAGGSIGLGRAAAWARAEPGSRVLLLVVELCGLAFRLGDRRKSNIIATALFGDGAAACLVGGDPPDAASAPAMVKGWGEYTWPDSLDIMGWSIEEDGFGVIFSRDIPALIRRDLRPAAEAFLDRHGLGLGDLQGLICHPGGTKVLAAVEEALGFAPHSLDPERSVLRRHGNMSAPTVLFVLAERLARGDRGAHLMLALGPGFTVGFALLRLGAAEAGA
jgi:alkylresorcinol/alkylpyrone synthase